jgi:hypothetical protein
LRRKLFGLSISRPQNNHSKGEGGNARASRFRKEALERKRLPEEFRLPVPFPKSQELKTAAHRQIRARHHRPADFNYRPV